MSRKEHIEEWMRQNGYWYSRRPFNINEVIEIVGRFLDDPSVKESKPENWRRPPEAL